MPTQEMYVRNQSIARRMTVANHMKVEPIYIILCQNKYQEKLNHTVINEEGRETGVEQNQQRSGMDIKHEINNQ